MATAPPAQQSARSPRRGRAGAGRSRRAGSRRCGRSRTATPSPRASAASKAATCSSASAGPSGEGAKTSLATASWSGWISVLPSKPMSRPWTQAARRPSWSWKALIDAVDADQPLGAGGEQAEPEAGDERQPVGRLGGAEILDEVVGAQDEALQPRVRRGDRGGVQHRRAASPSSPRCGALRRAVPRRISSARRGGCRPAVSTFGSRIASGPAAQARARSASPHSVSRPLIRTSSLAPRRSRRPRPPRPRARARAASRRARRRPRGRGSARPPAACAPSPARAASSRACRGPSGRAWSCLRHGVPEALLRCE